MYSIFETSSFFISKETTKCFHLFFNKSLILFHKERTINKNTLAIVKTNYKHCHFMYTKPQCRCLKLLFKNCLSVKFVL